MKIEDVTPMHLRCGVGACPGIFRTDRDTFLVVGPPLSRDQVKTLLPERVSSNEMVIEIPIDLLDIGPRKDCS